MKKLLTTLSTAAVMISSVYADISTKQVETYMELSGADTMLTDMQSQMSENIEQQLMMRGQKIDPKVVTIITDIFSKDENINQFTMGLKKLSEDDYKSITTFYKSDLGKKVAQIAKDTDTANQQENMMLYIQQLQETPLSQKRLELHRALIDSMEMEAFYLNMMKEMILSMNKSIPAEQRMTQEQFDARIAQMEPMMAQQAQLSVAYSYRSLNDQELQALIDYSKTKAGQSELQAVMEGTTTYIQSVMSETMKAALENAKANAPQKQAA